MPEEKFNEHKYDEAVLMCKSISRYWDGDEPIKKFKADIDFVQTNLIDAIEEINVLRKVIYMMAKGEKE